MCSVVSCLLLVRASAGHGTRSQCPNFLSWHCLAWGSSEMLRIQRFLCQDKNVLWFSRKKWLCLGCVSYLRVARTSKATQSREKFVMVHLALRSSFLVCLRMHTLSVASVAADQNWNILYVCVLIHMCLKLGARVRGCFSQKVKRSFKPEKNRRWLWSLI